MILAVESSCDESALAIWEPGRRTAREWLVSQIDMHAVYGGVVPELASREHLRAFPLLLKEVLGELGEESKPELIAVTRGPGLAPCLALGISMARSLALRWGCPLVGVNHLRAHFFSPFIPLMEGTAPVEPRKVLEPHQPHLGLLVSGGNTLLGAFDGVVWKLLAQTEDDAAGEALDKGAKLLGLAYPGGPRVEREARSGDPRKQEFPSGRDGRMRGRFSFSGLKTSLRYRLEGLSEAEVLSCRADLCAGYQEAVIDQLVRRCSEELEGGGYRSLGLSGGVANNESLRGRLGELADRFGVSFLPAEKAHTGDNAGMIAFTAWLDLEAGLIPVEGVEPRLEPSLIADQL